MKKSRIAKAWAFISKNEGERYFQVFAHSNKRECQWYRDNWDQRKTCSEVVPIVIPLRGKVRR